MNPLKSLFLEELADRYDSEKQLVVSLPKMQRLTTSESLQKQIHAHFVETEDHVKQLEKVFAAFDEKPKAKRCEATVGLLKEGDELVAGLKGSPALNAGLISALQKVEHYEIASYGCLHEWAVLLGKKEAGSILKDILHEEQAANESLIKLARKSCNHEAITENRTVETAGSGATHLTTRNLAKKAPHSPRHRIGGFVIASRAADKCRASVDKETGEYHFDCPLDNMLFTFKGITSEEFKSEVLAAKTYEEVGTWLNSHGTYRTTAEIKSWSDEMEASSPARESDRRAGFNKNCKSLGLDPEKSSTFDWLEADDKASFKK